MMKNVIYSLDWQDRFLPLILIKVGKKKPLQINEAATLIYEKSVYCLFYYSLIMV